MLYLVHNEEWIMNTCSNCGANIEQGETFCKVCGNQITNIGNADNLINAYIGDNVDAVDAIRNRVFSFNTFLFGIYYVIYRKV